MGLRSVAISSLDELSATAGRAIFVGRHPLSTHHRNHTTPTRACILNERKAGVTSEQDACGQDGAKNEFIGTNARHKE